MPFRERFSPQEIDILRQRAARIAGQTRSHIEADNTNTGLQIRVQSERYALPLSDLTAVYQAIRVVPVPCTPQFVAGIANIRGHMIPVYDLGLLLGVDGPSPSGAAVLVVVTHGAITLALRVHAIGDVMPLPADQIAPLPTTLELAKTSYLHGTLPDGTAILNVPAILRDPMLVIDDNVR